MEGTEQTGLYCFIDGSRVCGADCMAYETPPNHKDYVGKQWASCLILVNLHRTGKHLPILASSADILSKAKQDEIRMAHPMVK